MVLPMFNSSQKPAGRFAPSPTGPLHLGSLIAAVGSYLLARKAGLRWLVRIDDLDRHRVVDSAADDILNLLETLGFEWDAAPLWQSQRAERYTEVLHRLKDEGRVYPCSCSRKEILASAPHAGEEGPIYPGTCRNGPVGNREQLAWRLKVGGPPIAFRDGLYGFRQQELQHDVGDFVLFRADGLFAYQLATVVDDLDSCVSQVVRGADLLGSTARQIYLYRCLGQQEPEYLHLPLVLGDDGEKVSKRHGNSAVVCTNNGSEMLSSALSFLGQPLPDDVAEAPAAEILRWALVNFRADRIQPVDRLLRIVVQPSDATGLSL